MNDKKMDQKDTDKVNEVKTPKKIEDNKEFLMKKTVTPQTGDTVPVILVVGTLAVAIASIYASLKKRKH